MNSLVMLMLSPVVMLSKSINSNQLRPTFPDHPEWYVKNFSSVQLDKTMLEVLSLGPKFCIPSRKTNRLDLEVQFENLCSQTNDLCPSSQMASEHFQSTLVNTCYHYLSYRPKINHLLSKQHLDALKRLRDNESVVLCKPDKGTGIVLLDRAYYNQKIEDILDDSSKFRQAVSERDKTHIIEKSISKHLRTLKQKNLIDEATFNRLRPTGTVIPRLYGLPKVHKEGLPLRPILDMSNSPYHAVAKWLTYILEPVRKHVARYSLRDTFEFVDSIEGLDLSNQTMFSLDVASLFTNVPLHETVDHLCNLIHDAAINIGLPTDELKRLLIMCTENIQFKFNDKLYRQKDGAAMGSPLGPLLADIFLSKLENNEFKEIIEGLTSYRRYVDDNFHVATNDQHLEAKLNRFNSAQANAVFTLEL